MIRLLLDHGADPLRVEGDITPHELAKMIAGLPEDLIGLLEQHAGGGRTLTFTQLPEFVG